MTARSLLISVTVLITSAVRAADESPAPFDVQVVGSGRPMIMIPGLGCGGDVWKETAQHFSDRYQCHVLTLAGFAGQPSIDPPLLPQVRDGVIDYIDAHHLERPIIMGHSMGGLLTYWIAATASERVGPIIAVDGIPFFSALDDPDATAESAALGADRKRTFIQNAGPLQTAIQNRVAMASMVTDSADLMRLVTVNNQSDPQAVGQAMYELHTTDLRNQLHRITTPVLLIGCTGSSPNEQDRLTKESRYRQQVAAIPDHAVVFHSVSRHFIQFDAPEFLWTTIEVFLKHTDTVNAGSHD